MGDEANKRAGEIDIKGSSESIQTRMRESIDSKGSGDNIKTTLSPELKERAKALTLDICAELVAAEISYLFRNTVNRHPHHPK